MNTPFFRYVTVFAFWFSLALSAIAQDRMWIWAAELRKRSPAADATKNFQTRDIYLIGIMGVGALAYPGVPAEIAQPIKEKYGSRTLKELSDAVRGDDAYKAYADAAVSYASAYNTQTVKLLQAELPSEKR